MIVTLALDSANSTAEPDRFGSSGDNVSYAFIRRSMHKIHTRKGFKRTLFIRTKHNQRIIGKIPLWSYKMTPKQQLNSTKRWKCRFLFQVFEQCVALRHVMSFQFAVATFSDSLSCVRRRGRSGRQSGWCLAMSLQTGAVNKEIKT